MGYIAKAAVRTANNELRALIATELREQQRIYGVWGELIYCEPYCPSSVTSGRMGAIMLDSDCIDCGCYTPNDTEEEAVRLFLELAQMDEYDASTLWVKMEQPKETRGTHWIETTYHKDWSSSNELIEAVCENWVTTLTPLEVAEAFRDGRIKL